MTRTLVNNIDATLKSFVDAMGSGKSATKHLSTLVHDCANAGNTGPLSSAINRLDKKGDVSGSRVVRQVFSTIFIDAKAKMNNAYQRHEDSYDARFESAFSKGYEQGFKDGQKK